MDSFESAVRVDLCKILVEPILQWHMHTHRGGVAWTGWARTAQNSRVGGDGDCDLKGRRLVDRVAQIRYFAPRRSAAGNEIFDVSGEATMRLLEGL